MSKSEWVTTVRLFSFTIWDSTSESALANIAAQQPE